MLRVRHVPLSAGGQILGGWSTLRASLKESPPEPPSLGDAPVTRKMCTHSRCLRRSCQINATSDRSWWLSPRTLTLCDRRVMAAKPRAITHENFGAWLIKGSRDVYPVDKLVRTRFSTVEGWSLRPTYRTDLIERGQAVLFWISGDDDQHPAGIYAAGRTTGGAWKDVADDRWVKEAERGTPKLFMPVELGPVSPPVLRAEIMLHPVLSQIEVVKMAAGSNPSFLTREELSALRREWPQVTVD